MNRAEKEAYLREYGKLKAEGEPFFPYSVGKDGIVAVIVMAIIIAMSLFLGAEMGPKADPTSTTYVPRPEWYFFFLFELLKVIKPPQLVPLATIGVPTLGLILLALLPFYDRRAERHPLKRPVATTAGIMVIFAMTYLTLLGSEAGSPNEIDMEPPVALAGPALELWERGRIVTGQSGCLACHQIGENGNNGPGPKLTHIASKLPEQAIAQTLRNPTAPMPSFANLEEKSPEKFKAMVSFLGQLN